MPRTVLVTEGDSPLGEALVRLLRERGCSVVATREPSTDGSAAVFERGPLVVPWNRRSPLSARTVLLSALNAFGGIDDALLLEPPCAAPGSLAEVDSAAVDRAFDDARGPVFLAREILRQFRSAGAGVMALVGRGGAPIALEAAMRECFRGVAAALLAEAAAGVPVVNGYQQGDAEPSDFAAFIDRTLEEKGRRISGRWFTCPSRGGIFPGILSPRK